MRGAVNAPLVIDSTELPVLEAALKLYGGKPIINSINFEDGEAPAEKRLELARRFGTAVIALTIDEQGMAKEVDRKLEVAHRLHDFACKRHGLPAADLMFDPLTFTICTGNEDDRKLGLWTLEAIERLSRELPECQIILGLSNISFGLNPPARHVLNSVFLDHALKRGLTGAIVHVSKIMPLHRIPEEEARIAEDLIFDRRREGYDPLHAFIALFENRVTAKAAKKARPETVEERLKQRIVDGDRHGLEEDLALAMTKHPPLDIINIFLLDGMKVVGELFGAGKMQLPFVLQSAETMKAAVALARAASWSGSTASRRARSCSPPSRATCTTSARTWSTSSSPTTATAWSISASSSRSPPSSTPRRSTRRDAVGMSGLLVKSTVVMRENLEEMTRRASPCR